MRMKTVAAIFATFLIVLVISPHAFSATDYVTCQVKRASSANGVTTLLLKYIEGSTTKWSGYKWFSVISSINEEALAVGLSAIALDYYIRVGRTSGRYILTTVGLQADTY